MIYKRVIITFNEDLIVGSTIDLFGFYYHESFGIDHHVNSWVSHRSLSGEVTVGIPTATAGEITAIYFREAFSLDYGGYFKITRNKNTVTITAKSYYWSFTGVEFTPDDPTLISYLFEDYVTVTPMPYEYVDSPFLDGNLYFTKSLDFIKFNSTTMGTYIDFEIEIKVFKLNTYEPVIYNRNYKFPLFQGKGEFHIGTIVDALLEEINDLTDFVPTYKSNYYKSQYRPAEINVSLEEKSFDSEIFSVINGSLPMFKMAKGYSPLMTESQMGLLTVSQQEITRITPQSVVAASFVYFGTPRIVVKKNNLIIEDFEIVPVADQIIYTYFRFANDLKPGDSLDVILINGLETRSQRYLVFQNGMENTYFFFENDNWLIEPYEFSGRRRGFSPLKHITTPKLKNLNPFNKKVKTVVEQTFTINTGQLTKNDHRIITAICKSLNVWCSFDNPEGPYYKVDATTSRIANHDTSANEEGFDIEFNLLENADASILPF